jgi:hypothetical protein
MAYSNRVASKSSIINQNQGGGMKKAGLAITPLTASTRIAFNVRGMPQSLTTMQINPHPNVCQSRPVGWRMRMMCF